MSEVVVRISSRVWARVFRFEVSGFSVQVSAQPLAEAASLIE
jgi:hypothetical protein